MSKHHKYSPSKLEQFDLCPGSLSLSEGLPDEISDDAQIGTMLHERVKNRNLEELTAEQEKWVQKCIDFLDQFSGGEWRQEVEIALVNENFEVELSGTADALMISGGEIFLADWKFGRNPVTEIKNNMQIKAYSYMALETFGGDAVNAFIIQPPLGVMDTCKFSKNDLDNFPQWFQKLKERCENKMLLQPSEKACRYCKAKNICCAYSRYIKNEINALVAVDHIHDLPAEKIGEWLDKWSVIKKAGSSLEHKAKELLLNNEIIPGWELRKRSGNREVKNPQGIFDKVSDVVGLQEFMQCVDISLTKLEEIYCNIKKEKNGIAKAKSKKELSEIISEFVERKPDSIMLVKTKEITEV